MILLRLPLGVLAVSQLATLFTDAQWADLQSFLNFVILCVLAWYARRARREIPKQTVQEVKRDNLQEDMAELILDMMEDRRRERGIRSRRTDPPVG